MDIDWTESNQTWRVRIDPEAVGGYLLDSADFDSTVVDPSPVHYTELVGSTDPELRVAYQFFKWIAEDQKLSYQKFFNHFGAILPADDHDFDFIRRFAFRPKTPNRLFIRKFFKGIDLIMQRVDSHLEDLLPLRGLAVSRYDSYGVPVRTLTTDTPPKFISKIEWPSVNAAWVGDSLTKLDKDGNDYYLVSYAICVTCQNRLEDIHWYEALEWVDMHNLSCIGGK